MRDILKSDWGPIRLGKTLQIGRILDHQRWMIADFSKVLKRLEYMLLLGSTRFPVRLLDGDLGRQLGLRAGVSIVEALLEVRQVAVVVLNYFGR